MYWRKEKLTYSILISPLTKDVDALSAQEAKEYFKWYMAHIPERIEYLRKMCKERLGISIPEWKFEKEELLIVWRFFLKMVKVEKIPLFARIKERVDLLKQGYPKEIVDSFCEDSKEGQLSLQSEYILMDIGMFFEEMFVRNNDRYYWSYRTKPKNYVDRNRPLIEGFFNKREDVKTYPYALEPTAMAHVQALNVLDHTAKETDLMEVYMIHTGEIKIDC